MNCQQDVLYIVTYAVIPARMPFRRPLKGPLRRSAAAAGICGIPPPKDPVPNIYTAYGPKRRQKAGYMQQINCISPYFLTANKKGRPGILPGLRQLGLIQMSEISTREQPSRAAVRAAPTSLWASSHARRCGCWWPPGRRGSTTSWCPCCPAT